MMSFRGKALGIALGASLTTGCATVAEVSPEMLLENTTNLIELCSDNNPYYGAYDSRRAVAAQLGISVSHDTEVVPPTLSLEKIDILEQNIENIYEVDLIFPEDSATEGIYHYKAALSGTENDQVIKSKMLQYTASAWSLLPTKLITDSNPERVVFTPSLTDRSGEKTVRVGGGYVAETGTMYINYGYSDNKHDLVEPRVFHETLHGIDVNVTCGAEDHEVDKKFAGDAQYVNYHDPLDIYSPAAFKIGPARQFYNEHSANNVMEDRTTAGTSLMYGRGRVQPGDPDHGSEFDRKQAEALKRLNDMSPGIDKMIAERTVYLRDQAKNEIN